MPPLDVRDPPGARAWRVLRRDAGKAMSANLDLVRAIFAAWERGDFSSAEWADADVEWVAVGGPEPASGSGKVSLAANWRDFLAAWGDYRVVADEYRELDGERVLVLL